MQKREREKVKMWGRALDMTQLPAEGSAPEQEGQSLHCAWKQAAREACLGHSRIPP